MAVALCFSNRGNMQNKSAVSKSRPYRDRQLLWGASPHVVLPPPIYVPFLTASSLEKAQEFYFKEKFAGCTFAQNLAKLNIKKDATEGTIDEDGRFKAFKLEHDSKNAQLQCFELFHYATRNSQHPLTPLHREGYRLLLKSLDFVEENPDDHVCPVRLGVDAARDRLSLAEQYKLNALLIVCLSDKDRQLSKWETAQLHNAMGQLIRPAMD